ncbi:MAG: 2-dehydropantoate 2-reductase [Pseudomonadota bacterium]
MRITVVGCGALGSLFAVRLGALGHNVQVLQRAGARFESLRRAGLELIEADASVSRVPIAAIGASGSRLAPARLVIVLVKSYATRELRDLPAALAADGVVLTLQNGLGNAEWLASEVGAKRLLAGTTTSGAYRDANGCVHWGGDGKTVIGPWASAADDASWVVTLLRDAGFDASRVDDPRAALWQKLALNAMTNPLTALLGQPNGALAEHAPLEPLMRALAAEAAAAAARSDLQLVPDELWAAQRQNLATTARNVSSMLQDVRAGRPTEIESILGPIATTGAAPVAAALLTLVRALTAQRQ